MCYKGVPRFKKRWLAKTATSKCELASQTADHILWDCPKYDISKQTFRPRDTTVKAKLYRPMTDSCVDLHDWFQEFIQMTVVYIYMIDFKQTHCDLFQANIWRFISSKHTAIYIKQWRSRRRRGRGGGEPRRKKKTRKWKKKKSK